MIFGGKVLKKLWYWIELEMYDIVELMMLLDMVVKDLQGQYDWVRLVGECSVQDGGKGGQRDKIRQDLLYVYIKRINID